MLAPRARVRVGDGAGHRVRRVVGLGNFPDAQQHPHHHLHLMLIRAAVTDDGCLICIGVYSNRLSVYS